MSKTKLNEIIEVTKIAESVFRCHVCKIISSCYKLKSCEDIFCIKCLEEKHECKESEMDYLGITSDVVSSRMINKLQAIEKKCYSFMYKYNGNKRNSKGESDLHKACKSKDLQKVNALIVLGACVNVKDYACWTPLHEAVHAGDINIVEELLHAGSCVDAPGDQYQTPLQKAVIKNNIEMVNLLLKYGADCNLRNYEGLSAMDIADDSMKCLFTNTKRLVNRLPISLYTNPSMKCVVLINCDIKLNEINSTLMNLNQFTFTSNFKSDVTHIVADSLVSIGNINVLIGILRQLPIVTFKWLEACAEQKIVVPFKPFYILGTEKFQCNVMQAVETSREKLLPKLFDGINFYLTGFNDLSSSFDVTIDKSTINQASIQSIITEGGGTLLTREPHTRNIRNNRYPWHAPVGSNIEQCCNYILYHRPCTLRYNMTELRHMPATWLIECIWKYKLIPLEQLDLEPNY